MKTLQHKIPAVLTALLLGSYAWAPVFAATPASPAAPEQPPSAATPAQTEKIGGTCGKLDKDMDGYISAAEWKATKKDSKTFMAADVNQDGHLDLMECAKVLGG